MNKQTALNYLIEKLELQVMANHIQWVGEIIQDAKKMEREQIASAYENGEWNQGVNGDANEYIEKTFGHESND
jgi:hypothetical protein